MNNTITDDNFVNTTDPNLETTAFYQTLNDTLITAVVYFGILMLLGIVGNLLVCIIFFRLRMTTQDDLIIALALFDLLGCVVLIPSEIVFLRMYFSFGYPFTCRLLRYFAHFFIYIIILILVVIAVDRYIKVCRPMKRQLSLKGVKVAVVVIILVGLVCAVPAAFVYGIRTGKTDNPPVTITLCTINDQTKDTVYPLIHSVVISVAFCVTLVVLTSLYIQILRKLNTHTRYMREKSSFQISSPTMLSFPRCSEELRPNNEDRLPVQVCQSDSADYVRHPQGQTTLAGCDGEISGPDTSFPCVQGGTVPSAAEQGTEWWSEWESTEVSDSFGSSLDESTPTSITDSTVTGADCQHPTEVPSRHGVHSAVTCCEAPTGADRRHPKEVPRGHDDASQGFEVDLGAKTYHGPSKPNSSVDVTDRLQCLNDDSSYIGERTHNDPPCSGLGREDSTQGDFNISACSAENEGQERDVEEKTAASIATGESRPADQPGVEGQKRDVEEKTAASIATGESRPADQPGVEGQERDVEEKTSASIATGESRPADQPGVSPPDRTSSALAQTSTAQSVPISQTSTTFPQYPSMGGAISDKRSDATDPHNAGGDSRRISKTSTDVGSHRISTVSILSARFERLMNRSASVSQNRKLTMTAMFVTVVFFLSFFPHIFLILIRDIHTQFEINLTGPPLVLYIIFIRAYSVQFVINPVIYGVVNPRFHMECARLCHRTKK